MTDIIKNQRRLTKEHKIDSVPMYKKMGLKPEVSRFEEFETIDEKNNLEKDAYSLLLENFMDKAPNTYYLFIKDNLVATGNLALIEQCCLDALLQNTTYKDVKEQDIVVMKKVDFNFGLHLREKVGD